MKVSTRRLITTVTLSSLATATLMPSIVKGAEKISESIFRRFYYTSHDPLYEMDYEDEEEDTEDEDEDESHPLEEERGNAHDEEKTFTEGLFYNMSPDERKKLREFLLTQAKETPEDTSVQLNEDTTTALNEVAVSQEPEIEEAPDDELEYEDIYTDRTSRYDILLEESPIKENLDTYPEIKDVLLSCEEQNMTIEQARMLLRSSLRNLKIDDWDRKHPRRRKR